MADEGGERTEAPTPRRREETREKGQVAKSTDLTSALMLLGGLMCLRWFGADMLATMIRFMEEQLRLDEAAAAGLDPVPVVTAVSMAALLATWPVLVGLVVLALVSNLLQVGFLLTGHPLLPKMSKLNPINGVKRLFSTRTLVQLFMNLLKLSLVCFFAYRAVIDRTGDILVALDATGWHQIAIISRLLWDVGLELALLLLILGLADYAWQRFKFGRDQRMTKQEVKEEMRRMEGDPLVKQRQRKMQFAAVIQQIRSAVPKADVVVTNPTELAVAIRYESQAMTAPKVVAKGQGILARKIREIAAQHRIPIVERKPLAQALYKMVEVGQEVPERFYKAIAEILAYVYELSGRAPRRGSASAA